MKAQRPFLILLLAAFCTNVIAQGGGGGGNGNGNNNDDDDEDTSPAPPRNTPTPTPTPPRQTQQPPRTTEPAPAPPARTTSNPPPRNTPPPADDSDEEEEEDTRPSRSSGVAITNAPPDDADEPVNIPTRTSGGVRITGGASSGDDDIAIPSNAPTLTNKLPTYPPPSVPPTKNAPFMQKSSMPEGTVFIAVGSVIGLATLCVFLWRAIIAWSVHRSVERHGKGGPVMMDSKTAFGKPPPSRGGLYSAHAGSTVSLNPLNTRKGSTAGLPAGRNITPNASLFFSPTAAGTAQPGDRRSAFLPAGYYPTAQPQNPSQTHFPTHSISSSHFGRPGLGPSPPGSPMLGPSGHQQPPPSRGASSIYQLGSGQAPVNQSYASLTLPPTGRAPSAYLEDLFEDHTAQQGQQGQGQVAGGRNLK